MPHPSPGHPALARRLLRAAGSLAALVLLLAGVPWVLAAAGTLPGGIPTGGDIGDALMSPDDGHLLLTVLTLVAWMLWGWFALGVLAELPGLVRRRRPARRRRLLGAPQRLAGFLLGGLLILPAGTAMAAPAPALAATAPVQPVQPDVHAGDSADDAGRSAPAAAAAAAAAGGPVHVVGETGETVWDLAVEYLGSGSRAHQIRTLNPHLPDTALLPPGLAVQLPPDARTPTPPAPAEAPTKAAPQVQLAADAQPISAAADAADSKTEAEEQERTHTVKAGESLSSIAEEETGDAGRWPQLYEASKDTDQPGSTPRLSDPDLIYPGQQITVPATGAPKAPHGDRDEQPDRAEDAPGEDEKDAPHRDTGKDQDGDKDRGGPAGGADKPAESAKPTPSPAPDGTDQPSTAPPTDPDRDTPSAPASPAPSDPAAPAAGDGESSSALNTRTIGVLASLAAAVTLALSVRRILQRRRAKPGELIAMPEEISPAEAQMAQPAGDGGPLRLDRALRTLAAHTAREGKPLPELRGARITDHGVQVLPEDLQAEPVPPFTASAGGWWVCENGAELLNEQDAARVDAPYPGMVTIGADQAGHLVLLNLPQAGVLLLDGQPEQVEEVLTSLALEAGMSPWAARAEVVVVGFGEGLNQLLPTSTIAYMRESGHVARDFAERLLEAHQEREEARPPYLILCASELTADSAWQIAETVDKAADVMQVALIAPASSASLLFEQSEMIDAGSSEPQRIDLLGTDLTLQRLERESVEEITAALAVSGQDARPAEGAWQHVPSESQTAHAARAAAAAHTEQTPAAVRIPAPSAGVPAAEPAAPREEGASAAATGEELGVFPALLTASQSPAAVSLPIPPDTPRAASTPPAPEAEEADAAPGPSPEPEPAPEQADAPDPDAAPGVPAALDTQGAPFIRVLGPVSIAGASASRHGTREAQLAALLHLKPGRSADTLCTDMDPASPWSNDTLNARLGGLRRSLGQDEEGNSYVPRRAVKSDPYALSEKVCCDWHRFLQSVEAALPHGPAQLGRLEAALDEVRGRPFGTQPLPWSEPLQQEMVMRIVSVAHTVATYRLAPGAGHDLTLARRATATGLEVDDTAELLYRDWFQVEAAAGNRSGLNAAISRLDEVNRSLGLSMELETEQLMRKLLDQTSPASTS
ncbi:LysM peptidoglycan-binding domain-containing protein [Streptomyces sp. NPDC046925]|uniref:LysM peptidoglycan-binding domain-containing protein n=1 Tax=Streptomyces sp. NPDC046925 TaxID=3155375 RepID=UPI0033ECFBC2